MLCAPIDELYRASCYQIRTGLVIDTNFDIDFDSNIRNLNNFDSNINKLKNFDFDSISIRYIEIISIFDFNFDFP